MDVTSAEWSVTRLQSGRYTFKNIKNRELLYLDANNRILTAAEEDIPSSGLYQWTVQLAESQENKSCKLPPPPPTKTGKRHRLLNAVRKQ